MTAEINVFSVFAETLSMMSQFHSFGFTEANNHAPTVTRCGQSKCIDL